MKSLLTGFLMGVSMPFFGQDLKIGLKNESKPEEITKIKLLYVSEEYDDRKCAFTDSAVIAQGEIPHSCL